MKIIDGNICAPQGFLATGVRAGIRKNPEKPDLAFIYSEKIAVAAGVLTTNKMKAAPVLLTRQHIKNGMLRAIIINSGNANACTGKLGMQHAKQMAKTTAQVLKIDANEIAVASTGVIGVPLPIEKITKATISEAHKISCNGGNLAAEAIMTTDTFSKTIAVEIELSGKKVRLGGIAKGSGMIHPNMATMLGFITTDAAISKEALQQALTEVNQNSFNMISVDSDTSTNDMVIVMANGMAGNLKINSSTDSDWLIFYEALSYICTFLAKEIARDGEGATKLIEIQVSSAVNEKQARMAARTICCSPLVKTAIFGEDANWGRIACAVGYSGAQINLEKLSIALDTVLLFEKGKPLVFDEKCAAEVLSKKNIVLKVNLGVGQARATAWGCDLTYDYIKINASYRS